MKIIEVLNSQEMPISLANDSEAIKFLSDYKIKNKSPTKKGPVKKTAAPKEKLDLKSEKEITPYEQEKINQKDIDRRIKETIEKMKALGVYHDSYIDTIKIYSNLLFEYDMCLAMFAYEGREYEVNTGTGSTKKSGLVSAMEKLRTDILAYSDRLNLNPKATGGITNEKPQSKMEQFLKEFN